jgi:hypothetical protein
MFFAQALIAVNNAAIKVLKTSLALSTTDDYFAT